tara:strand:- start:662 stop:1342 length:681 start_codon:yes stop_codon:yes gene_type:complete
LKIKASLLIPFFSFFTLVGQNEEIYENWSSLEIDYPITKNIDIYAGGQLRIKSVGEIYNLSFYEIGLKIKINDFLRSGFGYRGIDQLQDVENNHLHKKFNRYHVFLTGTYNFKKYNFRLRLQFQRKNGVGNHDLIIKDFFRTKFELTRDIIDWKADPTIGIELFTKEDLNFDENFKKYRFSVGTKLNLNELNSLSINYVFQKEVKVDYPFLQHILSLNYNFSFKRR